MKIDELMVLPADSIDYSALEESTLVGLVDANIDLFIATNALGELAERESSATLGLIQRILVENRGDQYLRAQALSLLYQIQTLVALHYMIAHAADADEAVRAEMAELLFTDLKEPIASHAVFHAAGDAVVSRLRADQKEGRSLDQVEIDFLALWFDAP